MANSPSATSRRKRGNHRRSTLDRRPEVVHRDAMGGDGRSQRVGRGHDERHLVVECSPVPGGQRVDQQPLGAAVTEAFDGQQHPYALCLHVGPGPTGLPSGHGGMLAMAPAFSVCPGDIEHR